MKIGIITIVDYDNYGNRLQNYALQHKLEEMGHEAITILKEKEKKNRNISDFKLKKIANKILYIVNSVKYHRINNIRKENFLKFTKENIKETENTLNYKSDNYRYFDSMDVFVIGSDQIWNYNFNDLNYFEFGHFTDKPKVSYAASFGVSNIPSSLRKYYSIGLNEIDRISVREISGKKIIKDITGRDSTVVLDPTLLLDKEDWEKIYVNKKKYEKKFLLTYFLDEPTQKNKKYYTNYADKYNLVIKSLGTKKEKKLWLVDPAEFVNLFSQAEVIFTDSFHACVFSIIFNKKFEVFQRNTKLPSMNSRIDTLTSLLGFKSRWHRDGEFVIEEVIDYGSVNSKLELERRKSIVYLKNTLDKIETEK